MTTTTTTPAGSPAAVLEAVAESYGITVDDLVRPGRRAKRAESEPRQLAAWLLRRRHDLPVDAIARTLGMRDHTSAMWALKAAEAAIDASPTLRRRALALLAALSTGGRRHRAVCPTAPRLSCSRRRAVRAVA